MVVQIPARSPETSWGGRGRDKLLKERASKMKTDMYKICTACAICRHTSLLYMSLHTQTHTHLPTYNSSSQYTGRHTPDIYFTCCFVKSRLL